MSLIDPFENWSTADWMNLRLFVPDAAAPLIDEEVAVPAVTGEVTEEETDEENGEPSL